MSHKILFEVFTFANRNKSRMNTLKGVFSQTKSPKRNFIQENVRQLREMTNCWNPKEGDELQFPSKVHKYVHVPAKVPLHVTGGKAVTAKKSPELQNSKTKTRNIRTQLKGLVVSKSSPGNKVTIKPSPRKNRAGVRKKSGPIDDSRLREGDVAEYVRRQRETVLKKQNENGFPDSDLSLEGSDSDSSVEYIKPPATFARKSKGVAHRNTACQTVDPDRLDSLYEEGIIRYPSAVKCSGRSIASPDKSISYRNMSQQTERSPTMAAKSAPPVAKREGQSEKLEQFDSELNLQINDGLQRRSDYIRMNAKAVSAVPSRTPAPSASDRLKVPPTYQRGIVPRYLQKRQTQWQKDEEQKQQEAPDPNCPPGHVPLPDTERKETLRALRKSYADLVHELNMLPVRADTLRIKQRKMELEKQLNKLEEGIKVFSRPKVFVKIGV